MITANFSVRYDVETSLLTAMTACRRAITGLAPLTLWIACLLAARNQRILTAWDAGQQDDARRAAAGLPSRTRKRRRTSLAQLAAGLAITTGTASAVAAPNSRSKPARQHRGPRALTPVNRHR